MQRKVLSFFFAGAVSLSALGLAACGGGGGGSDESYVREMCSAINDFESDFSDAMGNISLDADEGEAMEEFASIFRDFANAIEDANPPSDLQDAHDSMVESMQSAADSMESGDIQALNEMESMDIDPELEERLETAAQDVEECEGLF